MKIINDFVKRLFCSMWVPFELAFTFWKFLAQKRELRFHLRNKWQELEDFMNQTIALFNSWGFETNDFSEKYVIDVGAGPKLRNKFFHHAHIIVIDPLARKFLQSIPWNDLKDACHIYSCECEKKYLNLWKKQISLCVSMF